MSWGGWEYLVMPLKGDTAQDAEDQANALGKDGWEAVGWIFRGLLFKRPT